MDKYSTMTIEDAKNLLVRIKKEIYRRSGMDVNGDPLLPENLRHYNLPILDAPDDSLFELGETDDIIRALNGAPIINTLINIGDYEDLRTVHEYDPIPKAFDVELIEKLLDKMESEDFDSESTSCRSACTGLCIHNCTSNCSGGCENSCSMCSTNCTGGCQTQCVGCSETCGTTCGVACGSSCSGDASSCTGCSVGCSGCTGCSETCLGSCTGCEATCYNSCTGGLSGSTVSACTGSSCSTGCGGSASSTPIIKTTYGIKLHHDGVLYAIAVTDINGKGTFTLPDFKCGIIDPYRFYDINTTDASGNKISIAKSDSYKYWIEYNNLVDNIEQKFLPGDTVYYTTTLDQYKSYVSLGRKATMSDSLYTRYYARWAKYTRYEVTNEIRLASDILSSNMIYTCDSTTLVRIDARKSNTPLTGANAKEYGIFINGKLVELPYFGIVHTGDEITSIANTSVVYRINKIVIDQTVKDRIKLSTTSNVNIIPRCTEFIAEVKPENLNVEYTIQSPVLCSLADNEYVTATIDTEDSSRYLSFSLRNHFILGADNKYHGFLYHIDVEEYDIPDKTDFIDVHNCWNDKLVGHVRFVDDEYNKLCDDVALTPVSPIENHGSRKKYMFTIPSEVDDVEYYTNNTTSKYSVKYMPGKTYTIYENQHIILKAKRK